MIVVFSPLTPVNELTIANTLPTTPTKNALEEMPVKLARPRPIFRRASAAARPEASNTISISTLLLTNPLSE
jgi:hypothetical protein